MFNVKADLHRSLSARNYIGKSKYMMCVLETVHEEVQYVR